MSSGDIDDVLASPEELRRALQNGEFAAYIRGIDQLPINREYDIPFGAGISRDGQRRYVDRHLHTRFRGTDVSNVLATHESWEWAARKWLGIGMDYQSDPRGHRMANRAELDALKRLLSPHVDDQELWKAYDNFIDPQVKRDETESIEKVPPDLDLYPYVGTAMEKALVSHGARVADSNPTNRASDTGSNPPPSGARRPGASPAVDRPRSQQRRASPARKPGARGNPAKQPKSAVNYSAGMKDRHCGICRYFTVPSTCQRVAGQIDPKMWCELFEVKK